jgi:hypothetical protein
MKRGEELYSARMISEALRRMTTLARNYSGFEAVVGDAVQASIARGRLVVVGITKEGDFDFDLVEHAPWREKTS